MGRILALDLGSKTIGIALSDETGTFVFPGRTLPRHEGWRRDVRALAELAEREGVSEIVVGHPLRMDGSRGIQAERAEEFAEHLRRHVRLPVHLEDERLSTWEAGERLAEAGRSRRDPNIDSAAAAVILQSFLDRRGLGAGAR